MYTIDGNGEGGEQEERVCSAVSFVAVLEGQSLRAAAAFVMLRKSRGVPATASLIFFSLETQFEDALPGKRGSGFGRLLLLQVFKAAKENGAEQIVVLANSNAFWVRRAAASPSPRRLPFISAGRPSLRAGAGGVEPRGDPGAGRPWQA